MQIQNEYIGDDKFKKMLEHYNCPTPIEVIKMKFLGAMCSPNLELRPADVISSFWEPGKEPRLETKEEADFFFKFFMGLWDELFNNLKQNKVELSKIAKKDKESLIKLCNIRYLKVEHGFVEGFWGGKDNLNIPAYLAQMIDSMTELAMLYKTLSQKIEDTQKVSEEVLQKIIYTDKMVIKSIGFIIENYVLPRMAEAPKKLN